MEKSVWGPPGEGQLSSKDKIITGNFPLEINLGPSLDIHSEKGRCHPESQYKGLTREESQLWWQVLDPRWRARRLAGERPLGPWQGP